MAHLKLIKNNYLFLKQNLDVRELLDELYQEDVISNFDFEDCKAKHGSSAQCEELLSILKRKGEEKFDKFLEVTDRHQPFIRKQLESSLVEGHITNVSSTTASHSTTYLQNKISSLGKDVSTRDSTISRLHGELKQLRKNKSASDREAFQNKQEAQLLAGKVESLERDIMTLRERIEHLQSSLVDGNSEKADLKREITTLKQARRYLDTSVHVLEKEIEDNRSTVEVLRLALGELGLSADAYYYLLKTTAIDRSHLLQCVQLKYDLQKVHRHKHINGDGELVNKPDTTRTSGNTSGRFQNYKGTTSTVPLSKSQCLQYVELLSDVMIDQPLEGRNRVLETGICPRHLRDMDHCVPDRQYCYRLSVVRCPKHNTVCTRIFKDGKRVHHLRDTLPNTAGSHTTLHYGIVCDTVRNRMVFLDVKQMKVLGALDNVDYTQSMWPMFGVHAANSARIKMKLVVGNDIDMTHEKKKMILKNM